MIIYACDASARTASAALCEDGRLLSEFTVNGGNTHTENLVPMTSAMFRSLGLTAADVDLFACSAGPGSFTGVRIAVATVKGLAFGTGKPCIGVSTLEALALNLADGSGGLICPVMDARRGQFYTAFFREEDGALRRLTPDGVMSCGSLAEACAAYGEKVRLCGDGYRIAAGLLPRDTLVPTPERLMYQSAFSVALVALSMYREGVRTADRDLRPSYLRLPQAERDRLERLGIAPGNEKDPTITEERNDG